MLMSIEAFCRFFECLGLLIIIAIGVVGILCISLLVFGSSVIICDLIEIFREK